MIKQSNEKNSYLINHKNKHNFTTCSFHSINRIYIYIKYWCWNIFSDVAFHFLLLNNLAKTITNEKESYQKSILDKDDLKMVTMKWRKSNIWGLGPHADPCPWPITGGNEDDKYYPYSAQLPKLGKKEIDP